MADMVTSIKKCSVCGDMKPLGDFSFKVKDKGTREAACKECLSERHKEWYKNNRSKRIAATKKWKYDNPSKTAAQRLAVYGITVDEKEEMLVNQGGACAICGSAGPLVIDHCHKTGVVRGLLCWKCNAGIGLLDDKIRNMLNAAFYLFVGKVNKVSSSKMAAWKNLEQNAKLGVYRKWLNKARREKHCRQCAECDPAVLGFYSLDDPGIEYDLLSAMSRGLGAVEIEEETKSYVVLCCNCHRKNTAEHDNLVKHIAEWSRGSSAAS